MSLVVKLPTGMASNLLGKRKSAHHGSAERGLKRQNVAELYAPTMVTVEISNSSMVEDGAEVEEEQFQVPRGLICAYSAYFDSVFRKQFVESDTGRSVVDDVRPWAFRVFIGWLYFQRISYIGDRTEPKTFRAASHTIDLSHDTTLNENSSSFGTDLDWEHSNATETSAFAPNTSTSHHKEVTGPRHRPCLRDKCDICEMIDDQDPLTWNWQDLFELYVFGEKYDVRSFRMNVLEVMQKKRLARQAHAFPNPTALRYLFDNIPAGSAVLDMVAKIYYDATMSSTVLMQDMQTFSAMPAPFLAICLLAAAKRAKALKCKECNPGKGRHGHSDSHSRDDLFGFESMDNCKYHEHGNDLQEKARCRAAMDAWNEERLRAEQDEGEEDATS
ncbi:hypothetical protein M409DRAFT_23053 [Zasmidium cellare ATCC 36951]|uniref:BTB domain-containing protein n=1 Tax=Zasmidium cellare ATCC 36951 TaxID=1080233 RepID=A0A6A6CII2_ZASCE|nr:uncharacterized protein M409DRAFT_23053 [Zasmidium cellare ATCC 36951]KAF2166413.1 hypothetical protein M409DRAFT_23053 [Zasmidium cellare ATCC 36951]